MKYAFAFAGLVAGALAGGECYAPPKPQDPSYYAPPKPQDPSYYAPPKPQDPSYYAPPPHPTTYYAPPPHPTTYYAPPEPTPTPASGPGYFGVISARSASPIHLQSLTARGGKFYLGGGPPSSYCPEAVGAACPPGNTTVFAGGDETLSLGVIVPGGQQVYVAADGALSYTTAHSAYIPAGSVVDQFSKTAPSGGNSFGYLNFETGFVACPVGGAGQGYQVYGQTQGFEASSECLGFSALTSEVDQPGAWQY